MEHKAGIIAAVLTSLAICGGFIMWASSAYAKVSDIPAMKREAKAQDKRINEIHGMTCKIIGSLGLDGDGC